MRWPRLVALFVLPAVLAGCVSSGGMMSSGLGGSSAKYAELNDGGHTLPAIDVSSIDPAMLRQRVDYRTREPAGTIVVDTAARHLYLVEGDGKAMRYGIGTARDGFEWSGTHKVTAKKEWPSWTPPAEMRKRQPGLPAFMEGGLQNPLGARALYIGSTLYRIHGTNEPWSIGMNVSSGCIRMVNDDVVDLYARVKIGAKVIVL